MSKKVISILCALSLMISVICSSVVAGPANLQPSGNEPAREMQAGCVDEAHYTDGQYYSDYAAVYGQIGFTGFPAWAAGDSVSYWGITAAYGYRFWGLSASLPDTGVIYKVQSGLYISVPICFRNEYYSLNDKFTFYTSANNQTWTQVNGEALTTFTDYFPSNRTVYYNVLMPEGQKYLKVQFPTGQQMIDAGVAGDWVDNGALHIGYAKASSTPITASGTGEGSGDAVADWSGISAKSYPRKEGKNGYNNRVVGLEDNRAVVRVENNTAVTLQNVLDGLDVVGLTVKFYNGTTEITDLSTPVSNGMKMKGLKSSGAVYREYDICVYHYTTPTIAEADSKKVLKPGVIDEIVLGDNNAILSDYARPVGKVSTADTYSWLFDVNNYPKGNLIWGQAFERFYVQYQQHGDETDYNGLEYKVVPGSYVAVPVILHNGWYTQPSDPLGNVVVEISKDGTNWVVPAQQDTNTFQEDYANNHFVYFVTHIPDQYQYLRIKFPEVMFDIAADSSSGLVFDWITNGAFVIGMAKASWTPITGPSGIASGDALYGWYEDSTLTTKDVIKVNLTADKKALVRKVGDEVVTLQNVLDTLNVTLGTVKFFDSADAEITDLSTPIANGQVIKGLTNGHALYENGTVFAFYTIEVNAITEIKTPTIVSKDEKYVIDHENKTITATFFVDEPETYADLLEAMEATYGEISFAVKNGSAFTNMDAEIDGGVVLKLSAKDCPGVPDGTVTAEYEIIANKVIKEVKFESKNNDKVTINFDDKTITVPKGMTIKEFLENIELQYAELVFYAAPTDDMEELQVIEDQNTVITAGMTVDVLTDAVAVSYEFIIDPGKGDNADTGAHDPIVPVISIALLGAAAIGVCARKKRK